MRRKVQYNDWISEGEALFGKDKKTWRFKCPACGNTQCFEDFLPFVDKEKIESYVYFSCIGRWDVSQGCDYTLGGFFVIAKVFVLKDNDWFPVMEFAKEIKKVKHGKFLDV